MQKNIKQADKRHPDQYKKLFLHCSQRLTPLNKGRDIEFITYKIAHSRRHETFYYSTAAHNVTHYEATLWI